MANIRLLTLKIRTENKIFLKPDFDKLVKIAKSYGWIVKSYKEAEEFIKQHNLEESTKIYRAFSYGYDDETIILYRDSLEGEQLLLSIAHEIGHLVLKHDEKNDAVEDEADEFARLLIGDYTHLRKAAPIVIVVLILTAALTMKSCSKSNIVINNNNAMLSKQSESAATTEIIKSTQDRSEFETVLTTAVETSTPNPETKTEVTTYIVDPEHAVYISKSGNKYHRANCYHVNVDNCTMISEEQAISLGYEPCKTCRPDVEAVQPGKYESNTVEEYIDEPEPEPDPMAESETEKSKLKYQLQKDRFLPPHQLNPKQKKLLLNQMEH